MYMYVITILVYPSVNKCIINASAQTSLVILLQCDLAFDTTDENAGVLMYPHASCPLCQYSTRVIQNSTLTLDELAHQTN